jgi:hypothetical protein
MLSLILSLSLFIPGVFLLAYIARRSICRISLIEYILYGNAIWNYVFVSVSILIGLFSDLLKEFYTAFALLCLLSIVVGLILNLDVIKGLVLKLFRCNIKSQIKITLKFSTKVMKHILLTSIIALLLVINLLLVNYHSIIYEWDAVYNYIPIAKSLLSSGRLSNTLRDLNFVEYSPAIPIFYSYILHFGGNIEDLYIITSIFLVLTALAIFELARKIGLGNASFIAPLIFMISPSIQIVLGSRALYLDLPFLFYFVTSLLLIIKITAEESEAKILEKILLLSNFTLLFLTRIEVSLFVLPTLFIAYLLPSSIGMKIDLPLAFLVLFSMPIIRDARHIIFGGVVTSCRFVSIYTPYLVAFTILLIVYVFSKEGKLINFSRNIVHVKEQLISLLVWLITLAPALSYFIVNNILRGGLLLSGFFISPKYQELAIFYNQLFSSFIIEQYTCFPCKNILAALTSWWNFAPLLGPTLLGLVRSLYLFKHNRKISRKVTKLIWAYLGFLIFWMTLDCDPQPRRILYLVPLISMVASYGVTIFADSSWHLANVLYLIVTALMNIQKYVSIAQVDKINTNIMHYVYPKTYKVTAIDYNTILTFLLVYLLITGIYFSIRKYRRQTFMIASIILVIFLTNAVYPLFSEVFSQADVLKVKLLWKTPYYPEVVDFYKNQSIINEKTLCFFCHELLTFTDSKFVDFTGNPILYAYKILNKLKENPSSDDFLSYLLSMNISYILIPTERAKNIQSIYTPYAVLYNNTVLGDLIKDKIRCEIVGKTTYFYIARLHERFELHQLNYSKVVPWIYVREKGFNFSIRDRDEVVFQGYPPKNKSLGILYRFEDPISLDHPIAINLSWKGNVSKVLIILYSDFSNRTTNFLEISHPPEEKIIINKFIGRRVGMFDEKRIEAIYIGLLPTTSGEFNKSITLNIKGPYFVIYEH